MGSDDLTPAGPGEERETVLDVGDLALLMEAEEYRLMGQDRQEAGDVDDAAAYYQMSLDLYPTAEAYVALGWVRGTRGEWEAAIAECRKAVALDPDLGNAYNDIGVYLERLGRRDEALEWLDRALAAPINDCRHYPWYHRGRILEQKGRFAEARDAFARALEIEPGWEPARTAYRRAVAWLN